MTAPLRGTEPTELPCLDDALAFAYVAGTLDEERRAKAIAHLDHCEACRELVDDITFGKRLGEATAQVDFGGYRLGALIAQGGMGRIYRAFDTSLSREVALKVPRSGSPAMMRRFEREAAITARLQHPGIVPIHAAGHSSDGTPFYVMRLVVGRTLDRVVSESPTAEARLRLIEHVVAIADTMAYVHGKQIVHRDLKPNNVLIGEFGETLIIDWGLAKRLEDERASHSMIGIGNGVDTPATREALRTRAGDVLGTPAFMPPEQAAGELVDERGDVYAIGALLRYVIAGRVSSPTEELAAPRALLDVAQRATARRPDDRFADAGELATALRAAVAPPQPAVSGRRSSLAMIGSGLAVLGCVALLVWGLWPRASLGTSEQVVLSRLPADALRPALSPDGTLVAYGSPTRLEVRDLDSDRQWTRPAWLAWPYTVEFPTSDSVLYTEHVSYNERRMVRWNLATDTLEQLGERVTRYWIGSLEEGAVWIDNHAGRRLIVSTREGEVILPSSTEQALRLFAVSPDRKRVAIVESTARGQQLRIYDGIRGASFTAPVEDVAALAFRDASTLLYVTGTLDGSTVMRVPITSGGLGGAEPVLATARGGWLGTLASSNGRTVGAWIRSSFESHLHQRSTHAERHLDKVAASAALAWRDVVSYWTFNSGTHQLERHSTTARELPVVAAASVPGDPASATAAGELLIVTLRGGEGREVIALHPDEAKPRWRAARGVLSFVRCAGDRAPPCIAAKRGRSGNVSLVRIDPTTGALGEELVPAADITDAAVDAGGDRLAWVVETAKIHVRDLAPGSTEDTLLSKRSGIHSLAFDPTGGILASSSGPEGRDIVRFAGDRVETVANGGQTIVSLIRPSPDGTQLLYRTRALLADLVELRGLR